MTPGRHVVEEKVGDEEGRALGAPERQLLERTPADEHAVGSGLHESEVAGHPGEIVVRVTTPRRLPLITRL